MRRWVSLSLFVVLMGLFAVGIVDSLRMLSADIDSHLWVSFIDRWQCHEKGFYEIEFFVDETFAEFHYGRKTGSGSVKIVGGEILLIYDRESCRWKGLSDCTVAVNYQLQTDVLILTVGGERLTFWRVKETR
jgi:hypothetical protein